MVEVSSWTWLVLGVLSLVIGVELYAISALLGPAIMALRCSSIETPGFVVSLFEGRLDFLYNWFIIFYDYEMILLEILSTVFEFLV